MARYVIKLGSSVVAHDTGELRVDALEAVCDELLLRHRAGDELIVVSSGAIARGMRTLGLPFRPSAIADLQAASAVGQGGLYQSWYELLAARDVRSAQVLLTFFDMSVRTHYVNARRTLRKLLEWRIVPVINENDTTTTDEISFGDNDFLAAQVAILVGAERLVLLTVTDGLYTADPRRDPAAVRVPEVVDFSALETMAIGNETSALGSGGMRSKVVAAEMATVAGIPTSIVNGLEPGALVAARRGERVGTRFHTQATRVSSFKLWLKYAKPSHGRLLVDSGAERALRERGTSLLPVGVRGVEGDFDAGDAVIVVADGQRPVGKGIVNYSAGELRRIKGLKTADVQAIVARPSAEAVHRDYFVLD